MKKSKLQDVKKTWLSTKILASLRNRIFEGIGKTSNNISKWDNDQILEWNIKVHFGKFSVELEEIVGAEDHKIETHSGF